MPFHNIYSAQSYQPTSKLHRSTSQTPELYVVSALRQSEEGRNPGQQDCTAAPSCPEVGAAATNTAQPDELTGD